MPYIGLISRKTSTMYSGLLSCAYSYSLSVNCIAYRVWLSILKRNERYNQISRGRLRNFFIFCNNIIKEFFIYFKIISSLLKCNTENLFYFSLVRDIIRVYLNNIIASFSFWFKYFKRFICIAGSYYSVRNLSFYYGSCSFIANIAESNKIPKWWHSVRTSCPCVCASNGRIVKAVYIVDKTSFFKLIAQFFSYCRRSRTDVFKRSGRT